jgi:lysophospholipase L1-like esterase
MAATRPTPALALILAAALALAAALPAPANAQTAVAFGDSVTKGFVPKADANIPYTITLEQLLRNRFGGSARADNANSGAAALLPAPGKAALAPPVYATLAAPGQAYTWAIFMVGTNDILMGHRSASEVVGALRPLIDAALNRGSKVMLLSMPPTAISTNDQERERQALNAAEKQLAREYRGRGKAVTAIDLEDGFFARLGGGFKPQARVVLEDGVHLCRTCYEDVGRLVYKALGAEAGWCGGGSKRGAAVVSARDVGGWSC